MALKKSSKQLVEEANARVQSLSVEEAKTRLGDSEALFVDLRDIRELDREGTIPGAVHAPRGMLEFWVDPDSPYFKPVFAEGKEIILYCQSSWRSALAADTLKTMGLEGVYHLAGGYKAWQAGGGETVERRKKT